MSDLDHLAILATRGRRARMESWLLLIAVVVSNLACCILAAIRGPNALACAAILTASALAHVVAWRSRQQARVLDAELRARVAVRTRSTRRP